MNKFEKRITWTSLLTGLFYIIYYVSIVSNDTPQAAVEPINTMVIAPFSLILFKLFGFITLVLVIVNLFKKKK